MSILKDRQKWLGSKENLVVGALVLLVDENKVRNSWSLGRIVRVAGDESHVRTVDVRVASGKIFSRDVTKVVHLEV